MNKGELSNVIYEKLDLKRKDIDAVVRGVFDAIQSEVVAGNVVNITGFGRFVPKDRAPRTARNPQKPGELVDVPARKGVSFKAGKTFKTALNS